MINYSLPTSVIIDGEEYPIRDKGDYRVILDIISCYNDDEVTENEKAILVLMMFYGCVPPHIQTALDEVAKFINLGNEEEQKTSKPPLMDWEQDFPLLISPINKSLGCEIRSLPYLHWWTFVSGYQEIDDKNTFSTVVTIRQKRQTGKKLDESEAKFYHENKKIVDLKRKLSKEDEEFLRGDN